MSRVIVTVVESGERYPMRIVVGSIYCGSLGLQGDAPVRIAGGLAFGGLALLKHGEEWRDLFTGTPVTVEPVLDAPPE